MYTRPATTTTIDDDDGNDLPPDEVPVSVAQEGILLKKLFLLLHRQLQREAGLPENALGGLRSPVGRKQNTTIQRGGRGGATINPLHKDFIIVSDVELHRHPITCQTIN